MVIVEHPLTLPRFLNYKKLKSKYWSYLEKALIPFTRKSISVILKGGFILYVCEILFLESTPSV